MNLLGRVFQFFSFRDASQPSEPTVAPSALSSRSSHRVQKTRPPTARQQAVRQKGLTRAVLREFGNGVPASTRRQTLAQGGTWAGEVDDVLTEDGVNESDSPEDPLDVQIETSQPDEHEIDIDVRDSPDDGSLSIGEDEDHSEGPRPTTTIGEVENHDEDSGDVDLTEQWFIRALSGHRRLNGDLEIQVEWDNGESTWEPERNIHLDAPELLFKYWDDQGGRPLNPEDPDVFDIVAIRAHSKRRLLVEWTGYPPSENTWLPRQEVKATASDVVKEYFDGLKGGD